MAKRLARIRTFLGMRTEAWPETMGEVIDAIIVSRQKMEPVFGRAHTMTLLGISEALTRELARRRPGIEKAEINVDLRLRKKE